MNGGFPHVLIYLVHSTVPTVSRSQPSARRGYFGIYSRSCVYVSAANYYDQTATPEESGGPNLGGIIAGSVIGGILLIVIIIASLMLYRDGRCDRLTDLFSRDRSGESERMD